MSLLPCGAKPGRWPGFLLVLILSACGKDEVRSATPPAIPSESSAQPALRYEEQLRQLDLGLADVRKMMAQRPNDALLAIEPVKVLLERARLSGDYANYTAATEALADAKRRSGDLLYPCMVAARLHYALHRLDAARAELQRCPNTVDAAELAVLRADLDFHSGRYREAGSVYQQAVNQRGQPDDYIRLALFRNRTGSPGEAAALFEAAEQRYFGESAVLRAWLKLQRGLVALDRGRHEEARALYLQADRELPGWWLIDEHLAEVQALLGNIEDARRAYEDIVRRTGAPEFMDALAALEAQAGHADRAGKLLAQARGLYEQRLASFPEAAAGHALDHYLNSPDDAAAALRLAQANHLNRPYGEASIALAQALLLNGRAAEALKLLQAEAAAGWDTPELHWILAQALGRMGKAPQSAAAQSRALAGNPHAASMYGGALKQAAVRQHPVARPGNLPGESPRRQPAIRLAQQG